MACPYFYPLEPFEETAWLKHPRLPLGDPHTGVCRADPMLEWEPDESTLRQCCNAGYPAGTCSRFPRSGGPDALRFSIIREQTGVLLVFYVAERNYRAFEHGEMEYSVEKSKFLAGHANELLMRQAQAYVESYLRRKAQPEHAAKNPHRR